MLFCLSTQKILGQKIDTLSCADKEFYDSGGPDGKHSPKENTTTVIYPDTEKERIRVRFNDFSLRGAALSVYDGPDASFPLIRRLGYKDLLPIRDVVSSHESGALTFSFHSGRSLSRGWDASVFCELKPCVNPPSSLKFTSIISSKADVSWDPVEGVSGYIFEYGKTGFNLGSGTKITLDASINNTQLSNLKGNTLYDVYIRAECLDDGVSYTEGPFNFTTPPDFCGGEHFYYPAKEGDNYSISDNFNEITIYPDSEEERVRVRFNKFSFGPCCDEFMTIYDGPNRSSPRIGVFNARGSGPSEDIVSTHESGALTFEIFTFSIPIGSSWDATVLCELKPCVETPKDLKFTNITSSNVDINWSEAEGSAGFTLEYGKMGFNPGNGTELTIETNTTQLRNLEKNTSYEVYLKANCLDSGISYQQGPFNFITPPDFCGGDHFYDSGGPNGDYSVNENSTTVIRPDSEGERVRVRFNTLSIHKNQSSLYALKVYDGPDASSPLLKTLLELPIEDIVSTHETGALTFVFQSSRYNSHISSGWDATVICEAKPCVESPDNLSFNNIGVSEVDVSWSEVEGSAGYTLEYGKTGFSLGDGTKLMVATNNTQLTNLESLTSYEVYIKSNCSDNGISYLEGPLNFTTLPDFCAGDHFYYPGENGNYPAELETGVDGYSDRNRWTTVIKPDTEEERVRMWFNDLSIDACCAFIDVYDGPDRSSPLILSTFRNSLPGPRIKTNSGSTLQDIISTHESGALTIAYTSEVSQIVSNWDATVVCEIKPCVEPPKDILVSNVTTLGADLSWNEVEEVSGYTLEYGETGFNLGTGTELTVESNNCQLTNLKSFTSYDVYIKANCKDNGVSYYSKGPLNFETLPDFCAGDHFYDSGGVEFNSAFDEDTVTITPASEGERVRVKFNEMLLDNCCNSRLEVYNGPDGSSPLIKTLTTLPSEDIVSSHESGALTFIFRDDRGFTSSSWDASVFCEVKGTDTLSNDNILINENKLTIYPIPNRGEFIVENSSNISYIEVFDVVGKVLVKREIKKNTNKIPVSIPSISGVYFLKIIDIDNEIKIKKFMIE